MRRLRQVWPDVHIHVRGDCGYGVPWMYKVCERLGVDYTFGISGNSILKQHSEALLEQAQAQFAVTREPQRLFDGFWYQAGTWDRLRWVIAKAEAHAKGTNRRFIVTNRPGARVLPQAAYDDYAARGESENRNKELKCDVSWMEALSHASAGLPSGRIGRRSISNPAKCNSFRASSSVAKCSARWTSCSCFL